MKTIFPKMGVSGPNRQYPHMQSTKEKGKAMPNQKNPNNNFGTPTEKQGQKIQKPRNERVEHKT